MQTLSLAEKATPSHVAPDRPSKCIPVTFSLVHPDHCCSLHSPGTFLSQSFGTCYFLSLPCSSLFRLTSPFIQAPAPMPLLQIGCFCSPCLKSRFLSFLICQKWEPPCPCLATMGLLCGPCPFVNHHINSVRRLTVLPSTPPPLHWPKPLNQPFPRSTTWSSLTWVWASKCVLCKVCGLKLLYIKKQEDFNIQF